MAHGGQSRSSVEAWYVLPLGCFALFGFAVAQPLFDLLAKNPVFLKEHEVGPRELAWLIALSWFLPGLALGLLTATLGLFSRALARAMATLLVFVFAAVTVLPLLKALSVERPWVSISLAALVALPAAVAVWRWRTMRGALAVAAAAPLIFSAVFVLHPGTQSVLSPPLAPGSFELETRGELRSVILVILDELSVTSLLSDTNEIDAERFPRLAALREDSVWFRHCATVSGSTHRSVPAILTGNYVRMEQLPDLRSYPENLFTLLADDMLVVAQEAVTHLSPEEFTRHDPTSRAHRMDLLLSDSAVVLLHRILPPRLARRVPQIDAGWAGFGRAQDRRGGRPGKFLDWVLRLRKGFAPTLGVIHTLFPHNPYVYYPDGTQYSDRTDEPFKYSGRWVADEHPAQQAWQRALLQTETADDLLGRMIDRLQEVGLYEDAVIAITADHGVSFRPGDLYRSVSDENFADMAAVPWLLKLPAGERAGSLDERFVTTLDILPTLADAAGFVIPWQTDGRSYLDASVPGRDEALFFDFDDARLERRFTLDDLRGQDEILRRQLELFRENAHGRVYSSLGAHAGLVGTPLAELELGESSGRRLRLAHAQRGAASRPRSTYLPGEIRGWILSSEPMSVPVDIAVSLRDSIVAVTRSVTGGEELRSAEWLALIPRDRMHGGPTRRRFFEIDGLSRLRPLALSNDLPSALGQRLGIVDMDGVEVGGIYHNLRHDGEVERWTAADASLSIPLREEDRPTRLRVEIARCAVASARVVVKAGGASLFDGRIEELPWEREFRLRPDLMDRTIPFLVEIHCEDTQADESGRERGVLLRGVWLRE